MPHPLSPRHPTERLVGTCPALAALHAQIRHLAAFDTPGNPAVPTVLLQGETGTGKGLVARVLHDSGPRAQGPFLDVNCAAIPETMLEAELFGFEAGAFTDAKRAKPGLFEAAGGGTLFLDEIDALPLALQGKLLTAIESKRMRRVGAVREQAVDVKLVTATSAALSTRVAAGQFRADLYYRLAVFVLALPPLRERGEDAVLLAQEFLQEYARAHRLPPKRLHRAAAEWLRRYDWPGNVRELSHLMERVTLLSAEARIAPQTLAQLCLPRVPAAPSAAAAPAAADEPPLDETAQITQALWQTQGNVVRAARLLGLSRKALRYRMQRYGLTRPHAEGQGEGRAGPQDTEAAAVPAAAWEQKPVAVLAIEMTWPAAVAPDTWRYEPWTMQARWERTVLEKVQGCGGVVLQRGPSLLLVAFGLPHTLEQLPHRAVQTAIGIRQLTAAGPSSGQQAPEPTVRQAVHWGQVLVDGAARDPTARVLPIAETLAVPVRMLGQAEPGAILVSAPVARLVEGWCEMQAGAPPLGDRHGDQAGAATVLGLKPQWSPLAVHGQRPLNRFVGRARELALLTELLGQVAEAHGQVVGLVGEAGVGKSRLVYELLRSHQTRGWLVLESAAVSYATMTPYFPVMELLRRYAQVQARDDPPTIRAKVAEQVQTLDATLQDTLPALLALLDVLPEDDPFLRLDPPQRRQRTLDACKRVVLRESQAQPLLLVCEDLHWSDAETQALLEALVESLPRARLLVLITYRPEYQHGWGSKTYYTQVRLDPLSPGSADEFLHALLGDDPSLAPLMQLLMAHTEGNPFFLEESVRTLVETGVLMGESGAYRLAQALPAMPVPATVQAVLAARLDRLPPEAKHLVQLAAVIGPEVPVALLQALAALPEVTLRRGLAHLQAAELLYETCPFPAPEYTFKHALTHAVAYGSLGLERRLGLHARLVEAMEALAAERAAEQVERLAYHALRGEVWDKAVAYCQQAGARAFDRAAFREAAAAYQQALQALAYLPDDGATRELAIDLRLALTHALRGEFRRGRALLDEAEILARALDDRGRLVRVLAGLAQAHLVTGDRDSAVAAGQEALDLAVALGDHALQCQASQGLGKACYAIGALGRAAELQRWSVAAMDREAGMFSIVTRIEARSSLVLTLSDLGAFVEGRCYGEETLRLATREGRGPALASIRSRLGRLYLAQGDLPSAIRVLEQGLALCRATGDWDMLRPTVACLGYAYALQGRLAEGCTLLEEGIQISMHRGEVGNVACFVAWLSEVCRLAGYGEEAWQHACQALDLTRQIKNRKDEARALHQLGTLHAHTTPPDGAQAAAYYQQALTLAEAIGMRPLVPHCYRGLGTLYAAIGQHELARTALSTALTLYRDMDMLLWVSQTEAALAQVEKAN